MPAAGFEPAIPASERPQTYAFDRAATGVGRDKSTFRCSCIAEASFYLFVAGVYSENARDFLLYWR